MRDAETFFITKLTKDRVPALPFVLMKNDVLGKRYVLSVVIAGDRMTQGLNATYRKKEYVPNVLSFPLSKHEGEVVLNIKQATKEARQRDQSVRNFVALLFVHALEHLKGMRHGGRMEKEELRILRKFVPTYRQGSERGN